MAVLTLAVIGICQIAFIRENALDLLIILLILTSLPQVFFRLLLFRLQKIACMGSQEFPRQPVHQLSRYLLYLITHLLKRIRRHSILASTGRKYVWVAAVSTAALFIVVFTPTEFPVTSVSCPAI